MLELRNVTKSFNLTGAKEDLRIALDHINLQIDSGEFVTIIGGNGSGKSTTMNIITGLVKPDEGQVLLNEVDVTKMNEHQRAQYFGHVFQDPMMGTSSDMSVLENLEIAYLRGRKHSPFVWGFKKSHKEEFIRELKRLDLGLETRLNQKVGVMSGGQRQALTLLMATMRNKPTHKMVKRDYIKFSEKDHEVAKKEFEDVYNSAKAEYKNEKKEINSKEEFKFAARKREISKIKVEYKTVCEELAKHFKQQKIDIHNDQKANRKKKIKLAREVYKNEKKNALDSFKNKKKVIVNKKKGAIAEAYNAFDKKIRKFDLTKQILLLDEHTAALDPKTAKKVLELTDKIVKENEMTTLMITHNMKDAITYGNRLIMFHLGHIIFDVRGEEKQKLTVEDLLRKFDEADKKAEED